MEEVGAQLERATGSHRQAMNRLRDGQGSLIAQAGRLNALGVRNRKPWPESVRESAQSGRDAQEARQGGQHAPFAESDEAPGTLRFDED